MAFAVIYGFPIVLMGIAAALGVGSVVFFKGGFNAKDVSSIAVTLAVGIPGVAGIS
jgi:peptidoglycan biosynthesis protein MviN/MurJ (putative lipid II flippase)